MKPLTPAVAAVFFAALAFSGLCQPSSLHAQLVSTKWLYGKKATVQIPKNHVWIVGKFDLGDEKVPSYEFWPRKSNLADNSYGTFIFAEGVVANKGLKEYVKTEVKPWFEQRGHKFVKGREKWSKGRKWTAETTYRENGLNYRELIVVWTARPGFIAGTVFGPAKDWKKRDFKRMVRVLDSVRVRAKRFAP